MKVDGRCHCGFITFAAEIVPEKVWLCHCTDCQTLSGSAFRTVAPTQKGAFTLLSGEVKAYRTNGVANRILQDPSIAVFLVLGIYLRDRGSPESKPVAAPHARAGH
jgi:hypothetical protein